ncbi:MAG: AarF/ABC1/UbiB kinase family protein [archaeon]
MLSFLETPGDIKRFLEIMRVFLKYGWETSREVTQMKGKYPFLKCLEGSEECKEEIPGPVKLRKIFEELGPTFIKFGQMLSTRPDLVKEEYIEEMKKLQDNVPPFPFEETEKIIKEELGKSVDTLFKHFEKTPVAAASIGQVHLATMHNGRRVAVKVQRPNITRIIGEDLRIMKFIAELVEKNITETHYYNPTNIAKEFGETIMKELDYKREATNAEHFGMNFRNDANIVIPKVYRDYSTAKVLTLERVQGRKISKFFHSKKSQLKKEIASLYTDCFFRQMLVYGFFQADPHPGNVFVHIRKNKPILSLVDFGMIGRLNEESINNVAAMIVLIVERNVKGLTRQLQAMGVIDSLDDEQKFMLDLADIMDYFYDIGYEKIDFEGFGNALIRAMVKHKARVPQEYLLFLRSISVAQNTVETLDPNFNLVEKATPYIQKIMEEKTKPGYLIRAFRDNYFEFDRLIKRLPESMLKIFKKLEEDDLKVSIEAKNIDELSRSLKKSSNTISISLIVSALILGSGIMLFTNIQTAMGNTADIGAAGFLAAMIIGLLAVMRALRG